jgi:hypothetical protein
VARSTYSLPAVEQAERALLICVAVALVPAAIWVAQAPEVHCDQLAEGRPPTIPAVDQSTAPLAQPVETELEQ